MLKLFRHSPVRKMPGFKKAVYGWIRFEVEVSGQNARVIFRPCRMALSLCMISVKCKSVQLWKLIITEGSVGERHSIKVCALACRSRGPWIKSQREVVNMKINNYRGILKNWLVWYSCQSSVGIQKPDIWIMETFKIQMSKTSGFWMVGHSKTGTIWKLDLNLRLSNHLELTQTPKK